MSVTALTKADWGLVLTAWIAALLVGALVMEHGFGMEPCPLCLMQRAWFYIAGLVVLAGLVDHPARGIYPLLTILAAVVGGAFAIRHIWIGMLPPESVPACGAGVDTLIEWGMWSEALTAMTFGTGDCVESGDDTFLGLSLPIWALGGFLVVAAGAVMQWRAPLMSTRRPARR